ncbi:MAG: hypothetical protein KGJ80_20190, partial [Chloroflexota bacterium]|nr:hypothetical protein [Chloroflexota bacterium]
MSRRIGILLALAAILPIALFAYFDRPAFAQTPTPTPGLIYFPIISRAPDVPPAATASRYMSTISPTILLNEGCNQAGANQNGVVVLDFGSPRYVTPTYGTRLFGAAGFASTAQVATAAQAWLQGYWNCSPAYA